MMGYCPRNCVRVYYKYGKCSRVVGGGYAPTSRFRLTSVTKLELPMYGPWKRVKYIFQNWGRSQMTIPTPPCMLNVAVVISGKHTTSYPNLL